MNLTEGHSRAVSGNVDPDSNAARQMLSIDRVLLGVFWLREAFRYVALKPVERRYAVKVTANVVFPDPGGLLSGKTCSSLSQFRNLPSTWMDAMSGPSVVFMAPIEAGKSSTFGWTINTAYLWPALQPHLIFPPAWLGGTGICGSSPCSPRSVSAMAQSLEKWMLQVPKTHDRGISPLFILDLFLAEDRNGRLRGLNFCFNRAILTFISLIFLCNSVRGKGLVVG